MNYSLQYFDKELNQLSFEDVEAYFASEKEESDKIEFKSYYNKESNPENHKEKLSGIIRTICGLLNSEGGIIIWGAPVGVNVTGKKEKVFSGSLSPLNISIEKDSFINSVTNLITPSPKGIKFQSLERQGQFVYLIEVEQSAYSPHQYQNIYYMRIDGQTRPAPHHYIEALFRKITFPRLEGYVKIEAIRKDSSAIYMDISIFIFNKSRLQNEHEVYYKMYLTVGTFHYGSPEKSISTDKHEIVSANAKATLYYNEPFLDQITALFLPSEMQKSNYEFEIIFAFGGKQSPLMVSEYKLKLTDVYTKDTNSLFTMMEENQYIYEFSDKINITEAERMKSILGR